MPLPYDPVKAHEYYLRTRHLRGRKGRPSSTFTVNFDGRETRLTQRQLIEQRKYAAQRIASIKNKLAELSVQLRKAMAEAKAKKAKSEKEANKPATASEKSKAARESKQYRAKNQAKIASKSKTERETKKESAKDDPVAELETKITQIKSRLTTAVARQRALTTATKNS